MSSPPVVDLITSLQEAIARVNAMLFNFVGALQRDAPPQSLKQEPVIAPTKTLNLQSQVDQMSAELMAGLKEVEALIQRLPEGTYNEAAEVAEAVALLQENAAAAAELQAELAAAGAKLAQLHDAHGVLAEVALAQRAGAAAGAGGEEAARGAGAQPVAGGAGSPS